VARGGFAAEPYADVERVVGRGETVERDVERVRERGDVGMGQGVPVVAFAARIGWLGGLFLGVAVVIVVVLFEVDGIAEGGTGGFG
jgi:hypothetical protein